MYQQTLINIGVIEHGKHRYFGEYYWRRYVVVAFGGVGTAISKDLPPFGFLKTMEKIRTSAIFIRDRAQCWYQGGAVGVGSDIQNILDVIDDKSKNFTRVVTIGNSMGGYAALVALRVLGLHAAVVSGAQTFIDKENRNTHSDNRWMTYMERIHKMDSTDYLDLLPLFQSKTVGSAYMFYGGLDNLDMIHAQRLGACEGVRLVNMLDCNHASVGQVIRNHGIFDAMLVEFVRGGSLDSLLRGIALNNTRLSITF